MILNVIPRINKVDYTGGESYIDLSAVKYTADEKYGDEVRVVTMGNSMELCAGTHVSNTADIKHFAIASVESIGSGIYRILAYTNDSYMESLKASLTNIMDDLNAVLDKTNEAGSLGGPLFLDVLAALKDLNINIDDFR